MSMCRKASKARGTTLSLFIIRSYFVSVGIELAFINVPFQQCYLASEINPYFSYFSLQTRFDLYID